jgi:exonuclease III
MTKNNKLYGEKFGYTSENLEKSCSKMDIVYKKTFQNSNLILNSNLKVMTMNIWGLEKDKLVKYSFMKIRMEKIAEIINKEKPDIICFQEVSFSAFNFLNHLIKKQYPYQSENKFLLDIELKKQRNAHLTNIIYSKFKPDSFETYKIGGNLSYDNVLCLAEYKNLVVFNLYAQAGSKYSPGQIDNAKHYSRCRKEQYEKIGELINTRFPDKKLIVCGDFNTHLDGEIIDWPEVQQIKLWAMIDSYRYLHKNKPGFTEDTYTNLMRWNTKFMHKQFRYDGILVKNLQPIKSIVVGCKPFNLTKEQSELVKEFVKMKELDENKIIYKKGTTDILEWWPSDHYGIITTLKLI